MNYEKIDVVQSVFFEILDMRNDFEVFKELADIYGDIFYLELGTYFFTPSYICMLLIYR